MGGKLCLKTNGITLIALVITIVVLLILAGVSISLIVGEDGVLKKATNSVKSSRDGTAYEQVSLAWNACQAEYFTNNEGISKEDCFSKENLNSNLSQGEVTDVTIGAGAEDASEIVYKLDNTYYNIQIVDGKLSIVGNPSTTDPATEKLSYKITTNNYGDYINYSKSLGLNLNLEGESTTPKTDWRIFYKDGERIFIIASDYVPNSSELLDINGIGMTKDGDYSLYFKSDPTTLSNNARKDDLFCLTTDHYVLNSSKVNSRCASKLLDTEYWKKFVDSKYADYAIGGPTIELFTKSWNAKGYTTLNTSYSSEGYSVNNTDFMSLKNTTGYSDNLYFPRKDSDGIGSENCIGYWIASPHMMNVNSLMQIFGKLGDIAPLGSSQKGISVRPIVCLKKEVKAVQNEETGIWEIK